MAEHRNFSDWRHVRNCLESALAEMGEPIPQEHDARIWNIAGLVLEANRRLTIPTCVECKEKIEHEPPIRCLDCKGALHERCAPRHFWPKGRPVKEGER